MDFFGLPADIERIEQSLASLHRPLQQSQHVALLVELAWYLRERDASRTRALLEEARRLCDAAGEVSPGADEQRLRLVKARMAVTEAFCSTSLANSKRRGQRPLRRDWSSNRWTTRWAPATR